MKQKLLRNRLLGGEKIAEETMDEEEKIRLVLGSSRCSVNIYVTVT
jgi:hypothetical protein